MTQFNTMETPVRPLYAPRPEEDRLDELMSRQDRLIWENYPEHRDEILALDNQIKQQRLRADQEEKAIQAAELQATLTRIRDERSLRRYAQRWFVIGSTKVTDAMVLQYHRVMQKIWPAR